MGYNNLIKNILIFKELNSLLKYIIKSSTKNAYFDAYDPSVATIILDLFNSIKLIK